MTEIMASSYNQLRGAIPVVLWPLFLMGIVSALTILICFYWLTSKLDEVASEGAQTVTNVFLEESVDQLRASTEDYAFWDLAYEVILENNPDEILTHIGSGASESELFSEILILSHDNAILHEFRSADLDDPPFSTRSKALQPFLDSLQAQPPQEYQSVSGFAKLNGAFSAVTVAWVTPDYLEDIDAQALPIMVGIEHLDADWIDNLAMHSLQNGHDFTDTSASKSPDLLYAPLNGPDGQPIGYLLWDQPKIGTTLRKEVLPSLVIVCISILIVSFWAAGYFTSQHRSLQRLKIIASTDQLTGILNRAGLDQIVHSEKTAMEIAAGSAALIYLDLNGFKQLNDQLGHKAGDMALQVMARNLQKSVRKTDFVARIGGDEFICLIRDDDPQKAANLVAERIQTYAADPIKVVGVTRTMSPSIGVAVASLGQKWDTLLSQADAAMYWAKRNRSLDAAYFDDGMGTFAEEIA